MGQKTSISWVRNSDGTQGSTFNPVWGCAKVGPGCDNCYAEKMANRFGDWWGVGKPRREFGEKRWGKPLKWNRNAEKAGIRHRVFCASMADVFDKDWPEGTRDRLWALIRSTPNLDWIILTKRIGNAAKMLPPDWGAGYPNVWLVITVVNQEEAVRDVPKLLDTPAAIRGLSIEPQLDFIDIGHWISPIGYLPTRFNEKLDWIICGAESGPGRRSFNEDWARALRDQCEAAGTAFFFKQTHGGPGPKYTIETPYLDNRRWTQFPERKAE